MNPLAGRHNELVWHRRFEAWGRYVGPNPADPASTCYVVWAAGEDPVTEAIDDLLVTDHPSAGQIDRPAPDAIEVRAGSAGSTEVEQTLWFVPGRGPDHLRVEAFSITRKLVGAGLFGWAEANFGGDAPARTERSSR